MQLLHLYKGIRPIEAAKYNNTADLLQYINQIIIFHKTFARAMRMSKMYPDYVRQKLIFKFSRRNANNFHKILITHKITGVL
jgi:hypothetical protein